METCYTYGELLRYTFGVTDKVDDVVYLVTHRDLVFNLLQGILYTEVSLIHQAVSIYDMAQNTVGDLMLVLEHHCIDAMVFCRVAIHNDIRRHIFCNAATCLNQHPTTDVAVLMQDDIAAQDRAVVYAAVACHCALDAQYAVIANLYVVAEVYAVH